MHILQSRSEQLSVFNAFTDENHSREKMSRSMVSPHWVTLWIL